MQDMIKARWNIEKGRSLLENSDRGGVSFEDCIVAFEEGRILDDLVHPSRENQRIFVLEIHGYAYVIPYVLEEDGTHFLKTVFPSRKYNAQYLGNPKL
jgi:hypothetical protein